MIQVAAYPYYQTYPYPYQTPYPAYQQIQQPVPAQAPTFTPTVSQAASPIQQSGIIWISGEREAQMYPVAPNNAVTLWSQTEPVVYLKQADATGKPTLKIYDLVERVQTAEQATKAGAQTDDYAKKSDLAAVVGAMKGFDEVIGGIKSDIEAMKGDMYGIAGKNKRPARKQDTEDAE